MANADVQVATAVPVALSLLARTPSCEGLVQLAERALQAGAKPELIEAGTGGCYCIRDADKGVPIAVFKPEDEEPYSPNNPKQEVLSRDLTSIKPGVSPGHAGVREVCAYKLDWGGFAGVPRTTRTRTSCCSLFHGPPAEKTGPLQEYVPHFTVADNISENFFPVEEVHKIAILDMRLLNKDRNHGNILVARWHPDLNACTEQPTSKGEANDGAGTLGVPTEPLLDDVDLDAALEEDGSSTSDEVDANLGTGRQELCDSSLYGGRFAENGSGHKPLLDLTTASDDDDDDEAVDGSHQRFCQSNAIAIPLRRAHSGNSSYYSSSPCSSPSSTASPLSASAPSTDGGLSGMHHLMQQASRSAVARQSRQCKRRRQLQQEHQQQQQQQNNQQRSSQAATMPSRDVVNGMSSTLSNASRSFTDMAKAQYSLTPIDHAQVLPTSMDVMDYEWAWMEWKQSEVPFGMAAQEYVAGIDFDKDAAIMRDCGIEEEAIHISKVATLMLQQGVARGLTPREIGAAMSRTSEREPSFLEKCHFNALVLAAAATPQNSPVTRVVPCNSRGGAHETQTAANRDGLSLNPGCDDDVIMLGAAASLSPRSPVPAPPKYTSQYWMYLKTEIDEAVEFIIDEREHVNMRSRGRFMSM